jgi:hypothetical protein
LLLKSLRRLEVSSGRTYLKASFSFYLKEYPPNCRFTDMKPSGRKPEKPESKKKLIKIVLKDFEDMLQAVTTEALSRFAGTYGYNLTLSVATSWYFEQIRQAATNDTPPANKEKSKTKEDKANGAFEKIADLKKLKTKDLKEKLKSYHPEYYSQN